jgi:hypothetical protein
MGEKWTGRKFSKGGRTDERINPCRQTFDSGNRRTAFLRLLRYDFVQY